MQIACATRAPHAHGHPGAADDRRRNRTIADAPPASLAFRSIADRRSPAPPPMLRQARRTRLGRMGDFPAGGTAAAEPLRISVPEKRKVRFPHPSRRRILCETDTKAHRGARPPRRTRRSSFPRSPRVVHRERPPAVLAHVEFPALEIPSPPPLCCTSRNFREKRVSPLTAAAGSIIIGADQMKRRKSKWSK